MLQCSNLWASRIFKNFLDIATINLMWFPNPVLALITHLDGANAQLFHVEHCGNRKWQYQIRWPDSRVEDYREWQPLRSTSGEKAIEPLLDPTVIAEVRWRWANENQESRDQSPDEEASQSSDDSSSPLDSGLWTLTTGHSRSCCGFCLDFLPSASRTTIPSWPLAIAR